MNLIDLQYKVQKKIANKELVEDQLKTLITKKKKNKKQILMKERALELVKDVALKTQSKLEYHLGDMVSTGLNTVFDENYDFVVKFEIRRGKTECDLFFKKGDNLIDPLRFSGLGAADIAAFCLRCAAWSMDKRYRNVLILDEPFKYLSVDKQEKAGEMVKLLSEQLDLQVIMISHSEKISSFADKTFKVKMKNGKSKVMVE